MSTPEPHTDGTGPAGAGAGTPHRDRSFGERQLGLEAARRHLFTWAGTVGCVVIGTTAVLAGSEEWPSVVAAAVFVLLYLAVTLLTATRMIRGGLQGLPAWAALGYLSRVLIVGVALIGGRIAGLEVRVVGLAVLATIALMTVGEVTAFSRARVTPVDAPPAE